MSQKSSNQWPRRGFLGGALVAMGAAAGWGVRKAARPPDPARSGVPKSSFSYDVSAFEKTDPALLLYQPAGGFETGLPAVKRIFCWGDQGIVVAGRDVLSVFDRDGHRKTAWSPGFSPHCLLALSPDELVVGSRDRWNVIDAQGRKQFESPKLGARTYLTSLAVQADRVYAADAGNREIVVCERRSGKVLDRFGKKDRERGNPGFNVPSPYFALAVAPDALLRVVNPGLLRIETYTLDGHFLSAWGEPGLANGRFCGCCNPVYFALTPAGDFITSEKGLVRVNVFTSAGKFRGAVAGPETLAQDKELARRACEDCTVGTGFDVTPDGTDILVLDSYQNKVRRFTPTA